MWFEVLEGSRYAIFQTLTIIPYLTCVIKYEQQSRILKNFVPRSLCIITHSFISLYLHMSSLWSQCIDCVLRSLCSISLFYWLFTWLSSLLLLTWQQIFNWSPVLQPSISPVTFPHHPELKLKEESGEELELKACHLPNNSLSTLCKFFQSL